MDSFERWIAPCQVGLGCFEHAQRGFVGGQEAARVDLVEIEHLHGFAGAMGDFANTLHSDHKNELGFGINEDLSFSSFEDFKVEYKT